MKPGSTTNTSVQSSIIKLNNVIELTNQHKSTLINDLRLVEMNNKLEETEFTVTALRTAVIARDNSTEVLVDGLCKAVFDHLENAHPVENMTSPLHMAINQIISFLNLDSLQSDILIVA